MLTPEIKTNLILKEIGIKRYSLRPKQDQSPQKRLNLYQKGHILAFLDKPYEDFVDEHQGLIKAIINSTKLDEGEELYETISYASRDELNKEMKNISKIRLVIFFGKISNNYIPDCEIINAPSIDDLCNSKNLKKDLWMNIKNKLDL